VTEDDPYYQIVRSGRVSDSIRHLAKRAVAAGRIVEYQIAIRLIFDWLRADPETLGEPFRDHVKAGQTEYLGFAGPVMLRYNIHPPTRTVYLLAPFRIARWAGF
jgi:hypothetical protein